MNRILKHIFCYITVFVLLIQCTTDKKPKQNRMLNRISVLTFNILQGGQDAGNVGFPNSRFSMEWQGSKALENIGLSDAYRTVNTNEVAQPGITWTPPYQNGTPGRQDYENQILVRIDRIYFNNQGLNCKVASVVTGSKGNGEIKLDCDWPSDHWAVLAEFE
jgi:hypothetical protein